VQIRHEEYLYTGYKLKNSFFCGFIVRKQKFS